MWTYRRDVTTFNTFLYAENNSNEVQNSPKNKGVRSLEKLLESKQIEIKNLNKNNQINSSDFESYKIAIETGSNPILLGKITMKGKKYVVKWI